MLARRGLNLEIALDMLMAALGKVTPGDCCGCKRDLRILFTLVSLCGRSVLDCPAKHGGIARLRFNYCFTVVPVSVARVLLEGHRERSNVPILWFLTAKDKGVFPIPQFTIMPYSKSYVCYVMTRESFSRYTYRYVRVGCMAASYT